ncbi:DinB family protein [Ktedonobacteria bacterium brp13]|nr:DinB family protein [Ktedonobacteria bacterium brp13]
MPTRKEIQDSLVESQKEIITYFQGLSPEAREKPCTESGVAGEAPWRAKDHLAHLTANEQDVQTLLRRVLEGDKSLPGNLGAMSREDMIAWRDQSNQTYVNAHRDDSMETLFADVVEARQQTLALLEQFTDEQLAEPAGGMFGADRTVGDMFIANVQHEAQHVAWTEEGFRQGL